MTRSLALACSLGALACGLTACNPNGVGYQSLRFACSIDTDCGAGETCQSGICAAPGPASAGSSGGAVTVGSSGISSGPSTGSLGASTATATGSSGVASTGGTGSSGHSASASGSSGTAAGSISSGTASGSSSGSSGLPSADGGFVLSGQLSPSAALSAPLVGSDFTLAGHLTVLSVPDGGSSMSGGGFTMQTNFLGIAR